MSATTGLSQGVAPDQHLARLIATLDQVKAAVDSKSFLQGPLALAVPLRLGDLEINVAPNQENPMALDVTFRNLKSGSAPQVLWTVE